MLGLWDLGGEWERYLSGPDLVFMLSYELVMYRIEDVAHLRTMYVVEECPPGETEPTKAWVSGTFGSIGCSSRIAMPP